ncbi:MAG: hypothetical protein ACE5ER_06845 [Nitrospinaceae bacterium]
MKDNTLRQKISIPPFSLRLTPEERAQLEKDAAGMSLGAYIRSRLFDQTLPKRRTRGKHPVKDHQELGKLLGELSRFRLANNLNQLAKAVNTGSLEVSPDTEQAIQNGCSDIHWMRRTLIKALGMVPENDYDS